MDNIDIRCNNCWKTIGLSVKNTIYKDTVTKFVLIKILHHVCLSCIFESNKQLEYDIDKNNPDCLTNDPWYNTSICTKFHGTVSENILEMQELIDIILCVLLMRMINNIHNMLMMLSVVVVKQYIKIQQQKN